MLTKLFGLKIVFNKKISEILSSKLKQICKFQKSNLKISSWFERNIQNYLRVFAYYTA